jgi:hypothetical protein
LGYVGERPATITAAFAARPVGMLPPDVSHTRVDLVMESAIPGEIFFLRKQGYKFSSESVFPDS